MIMSLRYALLSISVHAVSRASLISLMVSAQYSPCLGIVGVLFWVFCVSGFSGIYFLSVLASLFECFRGKNLVFEAGLVCRHVVGFVAEWAAWGEPTDCAGVGARAGVVAVFAAFNHDISCLEVMRGLFPGWRFSSIGEVVVFCQVGKGVNVFASANCLIVYFLLFGRGSQ